ncbi:acylneuraminate cytidylyltransferase family protein [Marinococcus halophilus]|uniref:acylneuraminate cytidylyltransferase family protein n=1 Tax=Marinococcus halophilus TaxID=1371 RepID=UPI0009A6439F|nr:acylneuraminate cytidylyltransferase family protein [Marinococcus halophilus]
MNNLAIIPARSGSKGLKDKNIKHLDGKPLIAYTIEAAINSKKFDEIMVSTDSKIYADISRNWGASVPFLREKELSTDLSSSWDVVRNIIKNYLLQGKKFQTITLLQPTSPLRGSEDIAKAHEIMLEKKAESVVSVCEVDHSPMLTNTLPKDHSLQNFITEKQSSKRRQDSPAYFRINGSIYIVRTDTIDKANFLYNSKSFAHIMSPEKSIDIDNELDFNFAEFLFQNKRKTDDNQRCN